MPEPSVFPALADSVVVITGASSGIGRATALALAAQHSQLCLLARNPQALEMTTEEALRAGASQVLPLICDVREESFVEKSLTAICERFGKIDTLVNSAGLSLNGEVAGYSFADWRMVIDTNLTGTFLMCRAVLPVMKNQRGGQIINISSGAGRNGIKNMAAYCAAKFGVIGFTESLALEVRHDNIRVSVLLPGSVATNFSRTANRVQSDPEQSRDIGYALTPDEVASVIAAMLVQPAQAWMSEVVLRPLNLELKRLLK
jgi:3-oxoacyl-[acyl-carrier protein] reductase